MSVTYETICRRLGFNAAVRFVKVLPGGAIGFTAGKPEEIRSLRAACVREGFKMSRNLRDFSR
jgi:hypothetical protein